MNKPLRIALIGYGRMGKLIEQVALERGHQIALVIDDGSNASVYDSEDFALCDVAIEFTRPEVAEPNCQRCLERGLSIVSGTTGWAEGVERLRQLISH